MKRGRILKIIVLFIVHFCFGKYSFSFNTFWTYLVCVHMYYFSISTPIFFPVLTCLCTYHHFLFWHLSTKYLILNLLAAKSQTFRCSLSGTMTIYLTLTVPQVWYSLSGLSNFSSPLCTLTYSTVGNVGRYRNNKGRSLVNLSGRKKIYSKSVILIWKTKINFL